MNDLGIALVWLTVQVTAVALAGLGLSTLAARRTPGAGATAALTALAASVVLAGTACCPLPSWWAWDATPLPPVRTSSPDVLTESNASASPEGLSQAPDSSPTGGIQLAALTSVLQAWNEARRTPPLRPTRPRVGRRLWSPSPVGRAPECATEPAGKRPGLAAVGRGVARCTAGKTAGGGARVGRSDDGGHGRMAEAGAAAAGRLARLDRSATAGGRRP